MDTEMKSSILLVVFASTIFLSFVLAFIGPEIMSFFGASPESFGMYFIRPHPTPTSYPISVYYSLGLGMFSLLAVIIALASTGMYLTVRGQNID